MPRVCTVCSHPDRPAIDQALVNHRPFRRIAPQFGLSERSLVRHYDDHLPAALAKAAEAEDVRRAIDHVAQLKAINEATLGVLRDAQQAKDHDLLLRAVDRVQKQIELQAKLIGELDDRPQINVTLSPEWLELRVLILTALNGHPEARQAVAEAISERAG